jgi:hypothetical protein
MFLKERLDEWHHVVLVGLIERSPQDIRFRANRCAVVARPFAR